MVGGQCSQPHHGGDDRNIIVLHEQPQLFFGTAQVNASAHADNGPFCSVELLDHFFDLDGMSLYSRLVGADVDRIGIFEFADLSFLDIDRNVDQYRALSPGSRNMESLLDDPRYIRCSAHDIAELDERFARTGDIDFLKDVTAHQAAVHLSGNTYQRDTVRECRRDPGDEIRGAGAARGYGDTHLSGDPGVPAGLMCRILFLSDQDRLDTCIQNTVEKRTDCYPGISEDILHSLFLQTFHNCIRCDHLLSS